MLYHVGKLEGAKFDVPHHFDGHCQGYERTSLIGHAIGSVHMGVGVARIAPGGSYDYCVHANEKGLYILEGEVEVRRENEAFLLRADDYILIPYGVGHSLRNSSDKPARIFEMQSPQPKAPGRWQDTFFPPEPGPASPPRRPDWDNPELKHVGHFEEGVGKHHKAPGVDGLTVYRFMEQQFGAQHFYMMRGVLAVGGARGYHDHPVEESYLVLSGEADMEIEGKCFRLKAGDVAWTGVGTSHAFSQRGEVPFRWIETQSPQFPAQHGFRNYVAWEHMRDAKDAGAAQTAARSTV